MGLASVGLAFAVLASPFEATGQETGSILGVVVDVETGDAIAGAQILLVGSGQGALSDTRGRFLILNVPPGTHTLRVVRLGFATQEREVEVIQGASVSVEFELLVSVVALDEIVVTGTGGEVERRKVGTSISAVSVSQLVEQVPIASLGQSLQARIPGVRSIGTSGGIGAGRDLRIRGMNSFRLSQRPVVYVDGVRIDTNQFEWAGGTVDGGTACCSFSGGAGEDRLFDLNPEEIERIEVLKGAAAGTLFGSEASSGVIQIFTKTGRTNSPPQFTLNASGGFNRHRSNFPTKLYPEINSLLSPGVSGWDANDGLIENGLISSFDLTAQGGGEEVTYLAAGGFHFEEGSIQPNEMKKGNVRLNLRWVAPRGWAFSLNTAYSRSRIAALQSGNSWMSQVGNAVLGNPKRATDEKPFGEPWVAVSDIREVDTFSDASRWTGGLNLSHNPGESFSGKLSLGFDQVDEQKSRFLPFGHFYVPLGTQGERDLGYRTARNISAGYLGTLSLEVAEGVGTEFSFGGQGFWETVSYLMAIGEEFGGEGVTSISGAATTRSDEAFAETINVGLFAQNRLSWRETAFVTLGVRVDGNSAFGEGFGLKAYPKADVVYDMSGATFLPGSVSKLRLRGAVGQAGMFPGAYDHFRTYQPTPVLEENPGVVPFSPGNEELKPETTTETELGLDAGFFEDRLGLEITIYRADTRDALLDVRQAPSLGFAEPALQNVGRIRNEGWELSVTAMPIYSANIGWSTTLNLDGNRSEILSLGPQAEWVKYFKSMNDRGQQVNDSALMIGMWAEGFPAQSLWQYEVLGYDPEKNQHILSDFPGHVGPTLPTLNLTWSNSVTFGPLNLYALVSAERGAWFINHSRRLAVLYFTGDEYLGLLDFSNLDSSGNPTPTTAADSLRELFSRRGVVDRRDHVRLREVSLAYQVPTHLTEPLGLEAMTLSLSGLNLHWWDDCHCMDPNVAYRGADPFLVYSEGYATPQPRQFLFTLRTRF